MVILNYNKFCLCQETFDQQFLGKSQENMKAVSSILIGRNTV